MAAAISVSQELLTCSVCLDILKEPVSLPCGHSFCMACILFCWDRKGVNSCPQCRKTFNPRPDLSKNILLAELVELLMKTGLGAALSQRYAGPVGVLCDMCIGKKLTAVQLCLTCELAFSETHMWLHPKIMDWKYYKMNTPPRSLQEKVCTKHQKALEYFCRNDNTWICFLCVATSHRSHETVELGTVSAEKKQREMFDAPSFGTTETWQPDGPTNPYLICCGLLVRMKGILKGIQHRIQEREKKQEEMKGALERIKVFADKNLQECDEAISVLIYTLVEGLKTFTEKIEVKKAEVEQLKKKIEELERAETEHSETDDEIQFLWKYPSPDVPPSSKNCLTSNQEGVPAACYRIYLR